MKIRSIHLDPNDDDAVVSADVNMTLDELALMYRVFGSVSRHSVVTASGSASMGDALNEICDGITGVVNRFYDGGIEDVAPRFDAGMIVDKQRAARKAARS